MSQPKETTIKQKEEGEPEVSIGVPVYNGEKYLEEALDSIVNQTYSGFEVIICDNVSTDRTPDICQFYADRDERITYHRNEQNIGGANNFNRTFRLSSGKYFKWVAHDDVIAEDFLAKCTDVLQNDPSVVVCSTRAGCIDEDGDLQHVWQHSMRTDSYEPHERFFDLLYHPHRQALYGLIRSSVLRKTNLLGSFHDSDGNLLAELSLYGRLVELPEVLHYDRVHPEKYTVAKKTPEERAAWFNPNGDIGHFHFPQWRAFREYSAAVQNAPLTSRERVLCLFSLLQWAGIRWRVLAGEVKYNMKRMVVGG